MSKWIRVQDHLPEMRVDDSGNILSDNVLLLCKSNPTIRVGLIGYLSPDRLKGDGYWETVVDYKDVIAWCDYPLIPAWYEEE